MKKESKIYMNGPILTMNARNTIAEALVTSQDRIVFVGELNKAMEMISEQDTKVDLKGCTMLPGFIDGHSHFSRAGVEQISRIALHSPPVGSIDSITSLMQKIAQKAQVTPSGQWILGVGYDDTLLKEQRHPTRQELDQISASHPIWLTHISNHMGVANSTALKLANIDESTPNPEGGILRCDPDGFLNGIIEENGMFLIRPLLPDVTPLIPAAIEAANQLYLKAGITTANEGGVGGILGDRADFSDYLKITNEQQKIRLVLNAYYTRVKEYHDMQFLTDKIMLQGVKLLADGSIQGYTGYLSQPYHTAFQGNSAYCGYPWQSRAQLTQHIVDLHSQGLQCFVHCNGDAAIADALYAFQQAQAKIPRKDCRHVLVHCQMVREDQLEQMRELGVIPSFFVPHVYYWGDRHRTLFLGEERAAQLNPCRWAQMRQMPFTLHCDTPVVPQNPLLAIWCAVNRLTASGAPLGTEQQSISPLDALKACTVHAAYQFFLEDKLGTLESGKLADFVILDKNPLTIAPMEIKDIQVKATIVGGQCLYQSTPQS